VQIQKLSCYHSSQFAMLNLRNAIRLALGFPLFAISAFAQAPSHTRHVHFVVEAPSTLAKPISGRLLIFLKTGAGSKEVDMDVMSPASVWVGAREVQGLGAGSSVDVDPDGEGIASPAPFATIPTGDYEVQAVLDVEHNYNGGRHAEDWVSPVVALAHWTPGEGADPVLQLAGHPEENAAGAAAMAKVKAQVVPGVAQLEEMQSALLTKFWGHPVAIRAWVILPPGYADHTSERFPTVYWTHGFGGNLDRILAPGLNLHDRMKDGKVPPMIWVMLDESCPQGTHEFADSVNNGPWGAALTTEFIPYLEKKYRMDARTNGRFLNGHSSGGWATLQLQINYPKIFGGTWSTSPDSSDFHDFTGPDLYAANANVYRTPDGSARPLIRVDGKVVATIQQYAQLERVLGPYGGQFASFDWVFSPRSKSGAPIPMFDRTTGEVDPAVVAYWHDHYDLAHLVEANWTRLAPDLKGRIHLIVGTADTFYLDGPAHKLEAVLTRLGAEPHFTYLPGRSHFDLYGVGQDRTALFDQIGSEMYAVARPNAHWQAKAASPAP
jgi:enterochelin esterase-like enzyme